MSEDAFLTQFWEELPPLVVWRVRPSPQGGGEGLSRGEGPAPASLVLCEQDQRALSVRWSFPQALSLRLSLGEVGEPGGPPATVGTALRVHVGARMR